MFIRVDLPDPDGPVIATSSPASIASVASRNASTVAAPSAYRRVSATVSISGSGLRATRRSPSAAATASAAHVEPGRTLGDRGVAGRPRVLDRDDHRITLAQR